MKVPHKEKYRTGYGNNRGISHEGHAGKVLLQVIPGRLIDYDCVCKDILPEEQCGLTHQRWTVDMMFVERRLQEPGWKKDTRWYLCFTNITKAYDSVEQTFCVMSLFVLCDAIIRQLHDGMQARVRLDDGECSEMFDVWQGLRQGCVLEPLLFDVFFTTVLRVADKRFLSDTAFTDNMVQLQQKKEKGEERGTPRPGQEDGLGGKEGEEEVRRW